MATDQKDLVLGERAHKAANEAGDVAQTLTNTLHMLAGGSRHKTRVAELLVKANELQRELIELRDAQI